MQQKLVAGFNSSLVRLKGGGNVVSDLTSECFNSSLVRLKAGAERQRGLGLVQFQFQPGSIKSVAHEDVDALLAPVSIPAWFD